MKKLLRLDNNLVENQRFVRLCSWMFRQKLSASLNSEAYEDRPVTPGYPYCLTSRLGLSIWANHTGQWWSLQSGFAEVLHDACGREDPDSRTPYICSTDSWKKCSREDRTRFKAAVCTSPRSGIVHVTTEDPSCGHATALDSQYRYQPAQSKSLEGLGGGLGKE